MAQGTTIENPVINSPYVEPERHFVMKDGQPTGEIADRRRSSEFFVPVARPRKASQQQLTIDYGGLTRQQPNEIVNEIRQSVARWRTQGYPHTTSVTRDLLSHWQSEDRERRLFFCQIEAAETAIYLTEAAEKTGDTKALNVIRQENATLNGGLPRLAFKMATGSGKTVVMAILIAWQTLNKQANPQDRRFSDEFLIVTPGITIRDRLRVLLPNDPQSYYRQLEILTTEQIDRLQSATVVITNYLDTDYDGDAFFVRHAYFTGADDPYDRLRKALRADISDEAWSTVNSTISRPFPRPKSGKIAAKVINHYGDEVMKFFST